jgi:LPS export ABC transporter protein LptC
MRNFYSLCKKVVVACAIAGAAFLASCTSDIETVKAISNFEGKPTETMENFKMTYSEGGHYKMEVSAPILQRYSMRKPIVSEFNKGLSVISYNQAGKKTASITSKYAIYHEDQKLWEARGNVVGKNDKGETLYTEKLFWNEATQRISSNVFVKVVKPDGSVSTGEGIDADERFQHYNIKQPRLSGFSL